MKSIKQNSNPPKIPEYLIKCMFPDNDFYTTVCDLEEDYKFLLSEKSKYFANLWYWFQFFAALPHFIKQKLYWSTTMFKNYVLVAIRNLKKNRLNTLINILGLSIAFGCCILIFSFIRNEFTYDKFHENADEIFEIYAKAKYKDDFLWTGTQAPLGPILAEQFPEIKYAARVTKKDLIVKYQDRFFTEPAICTDPEFFNIFTFPLKSGSFDKPLKDINSVILSPQIATKYFGIENPIDKIVSIKINNNFKDFIVTGILKKFPENSSLKPNVIIDIRAVYGNDLNDWKKWISPAVFACLNNKNQAKELEQKFQSTISKHLSKRGYSENSAYLLAPLTDYHLKGKFSSVLGSKSKSIYSYILSGIAALVLIIAICNFVNLSIGGATPRIREIGLRKLFGAQRKQLIKQFWFETIIFGLLAFSIGFLLAVLFLPTFNVLSQKSLFLNYLLNWKYLTGLIGFVVFIGIIAGSYPAIILSNFETVDLFRKVIRFTGRNSFSRVIIVFQFMISIFFISSTIIIFNQYNYMLNKKFGIDSEQVLVLNLASDSTDPARNRAIFATLQNNLLTGIFTHKINPLYFQQIKSVF